jgi:cysteine-rich repeat protein
VRTPLTAPTPPPAPPAGTCIFVQSDTTSNYLGEAYSDIFVTYIRVKMDGTVGGTCASDCTYTFSLPDSHSGRYTLQELVTMDLGVELVLDDASSTEWEGTTTNPFSFSSSEISLSDDYYCFEWGLNYPTPNTRAATLRNNDWTARVRIGVKMDDTYPCGAAYSAEGIGLSTNKGTYLNNYVNSGRLQYSNSKVFKAAHVWVYGSKSSSAEASTIVQLGINDYTAFGLDRQGSDKYSDSIPVDDTQSTWVFYVQLLRPEQYNRQLFRRGSTTWYYSNPRIYLYQDSGTTTRSLWSAQHHNGRVLSFRSGYLSSGNTETWVGTTPYVSLTYGVWHQVALVYDEQNVGLYFDGDLQYVTQITGTMLTYEDFEQTVYSFSDWWGKAVNMSTFQYFSGERLPASRLTDLQAKWQSVHERCGDGVRSSAEDCDDGNTLNGDGCSATCTVEQGFVCVGANLTSMSVDRCAAGSVISRFTFDNASSSLTWNEVAVEQDRFESNFGNDGWSGWEMDDAVEVMCTGVGFPSPLKTFYGDQTMERTFQALGPHNHIHISFPLAWLDYWSSQKYIYIYADGLLVQKYFKYSASYPVFNTETSGQYDGMVDACEATNYADDWAIVNLDLYHNKTSLKIKIVSSVGSSTTYKWGVANFTLTTSVVPDEYPVLNSPIDSSTLQVGKSYSRSGLNNTQGLRLYHNNVNLGGHQKSKTGMAYSWATFADVAAVLSRRTRIGYWLNLYDVPTTYGGFYL